MRCWCSAERRDSCPRSHYLTNHPTLAQIQIQITSIGCAQANFSSWTTLIGKMKLGKNLFPLSTLPHSAVGRASLHPVRFPNWVGQPDQVTTLQLLSCLFLASCQPDRLPTLLVKREIWEAGGWVVRKRGKERGSNTTSNLTLLAPLPAPPVVNM